MADERDRRTNGPIAIGPAVEYPCFVELSFSPAPPWGPARKMPRA